MRGSSPLTRGKPISIAVSASGAGLIPAHAGKTRLSRWPGSPPAAHPRSRGENACVCFERRCLTGSSPLTRGKRRCSHRSRRPAGLIPAHAGKTCQRGPSARRRRAHPRSRGENAVGVACAAGDDGSSPLTRGKRISHFEKPLVMRLIPAHAGKTGHIAKAPHRDAAHPRSRGENALYGLACCQASGSSPLTRGKLSRVTTCDSHKRLIPAHAGKTCFTRPNSRTLEAHPRSRGENCFHLGHDTVDVGSSPLTRGQLAPYKAQTKRARLIPAHAGKTLPDLRFYCADRSDLGNP